MTSATQTAAGKRQAVLDGIADEVLADQAAAEEARAAAGRAEAAAVELRAKVLARALKAEARRLAGAEEFETGARAMVDGLRAMLESASPILGLPGSVPFVGRSATLTRASRWLAGQLVAVAGAGDRFGQFRLFYTGRPRSGDSFVDAERALMAPLFRSFEGAKSNGHAEPEDQSVER